MIEVWRISTDTSAYTAEDLQGLGAKISGGRWNRKGNAVVYTASTRALACLETIVHLGASGLPFNRYLVRVDIPEEIWEKRQSYSYSTATIGWDAIPHGKVSLDLGDSWLKSQASAILAVPSIVVPEEENILINPAHPDALQIKSLKVRKWLYDYRLAHHGLT